MNITAFFLQLYNIYLGIICFRNYLFEELAMALASVPFKMTL
jgi:hypothetical protein